MQSSRANSELLSIEPNQVLNNAQLIIYITSRGLLIKESEFNKFFTKQNFRTICKKLTVSHRNIIGDFSQIVEIPVWQRLQIMHDSHSEIFLAFARFSKIRDLLQELRSDIRYIFKCALRNGLSITPQSAAELFENNQRVFDHLHKTIYTPANISSGFGSCILVMDTGLGKTYIGGKFIAHVKQKTLILLPNTTALPEWLDMLRNLLPHLKVGQYHSHAPCSDGDVVIMTINSSLRDTLMWGDTTIKTAKYFEQFGAIIYDEIHSFPTNVRQNIFWRANFLHALALTATPDERADAMDKVAQYHLGPLVYAKSAPGFCTDEIKWKGLVKMIYYSGPDEFTQNKTNKKGWTMVVEMCKQFARDPYRTALLVQNIKELYNCGANTIIFAELYDYLETLFRECALDDSMILSGGSTPEDKHRAEKARAVFTTFAFGTQSMSLPHANAIVFASPRKNKMNQILGRILRRSGDPSIPRIIIDLIDSRTKLKGQASTRKGNYTEKGFEIKVLKISFDKIQLCNKN
jgi:superfamily II DNA or RNA helicase